MDAFHAAGVAAGFRSRVAPGYREYAPGYYAAYLLVRDVGNPGHDPESDTGKRGVTAPRFPIA